MEDLALAVWAHPDLGARGTLLTSTGWLTAMFHECPNVFKSLVGNEVTTVLKCSGCAFSSTNRQREWITSVTPSWASTPASTFHGAILHHQHGEFRPCAAPCPRCARQEVSMQQTYRPAPILFFADDCERESTQIAWNPTILWQGTIYDLVGRQHFTNPAGLKPLSSNASHFIARFRLGPGCRYSDSIRSRVVRIIRIAGFEPRTTFVIYVRREWG
jgi:hypothetical protein